jgi:hypothetical protein
MGMISGGKRLRPERRGRGGRRKQSMMGGFVFKQGIATPAIDKPSRAVERKCESGSISAV